MPNIINQLNKAYFWDVDIKKLNDDIADRLIIERVLTLGNLNETNILIKKYEAKKIKETIINLNSLDNKNLN